MDQYASMPIKKRSTTKNDSSNTESSKSTKLPSLLTLMQPFHDTADYKRLRDRDKERSTAEIYGCMYVLADKYDCETLRAYVLRNFDQYSPTAASLPRAFSGVFGDLIERDEQLRPIIASHLARCYKDLRAVQRTSDWLELWLGSDPALGLLVMDRMAPVESRVANSITRPVASTVPSTDLQVVAPVFGRFGSLGSRPLDKRTRIRSYRYPYSRRRG